MVLQEKQLDKLRKLCFMSCPVVTKAAAAATVTNSECSVIRDHLIEGINANWYHPDILHDFSM